jgi:ATP-dependent Clp protease ATP-binding subunit ClpA
MLQRFFGGPIKAQFPKATPDLQKAFLGTDPVIIGTATELDYNELLSSVTGVNENFQRLRVPAPDEKETIKILETIKPQVETDYGLSIEVDALPITVSLANR